MLLSKEKAKELFDRMCKAEDLLGNYPMCFETAKACAIITVNEIIQQWEIIDVYLADGQGQLNPNLKYWLEVKSELEKL